MKVEYTLYLNVDCKTLLKGNHKRKSRERDTVQWQQMVGKKTSPKTNY